MRAVQLAMDVRVFDSIVKGETNSARELLAIQIDHNIRQLYIASKGHPLDKDSSSLYRRALDYWAKSPILSLQTNSSEGIKIPSIIQESK